MKSRTGLINILVAVIILIIGITVAYAALSTELNITTNKITQSALTWNVGFTGSTATATVGGTSSTERSCGTATITPTTVTIADTKLSKPDDSCRYTLTVKNNGTIGAKLTAIDPTRPSGTTCGTESGPTMVCGNITYLLASDTSETPLALNSTLAANASQTVYLYVKYTGTGVNSSAVNQTGASFSLVYSQN